MRRGFDRNLTHAQDAGRVRPDSLVIDSFGVTLKVNAGFVTLPFVLPVSVAPRMQGAVRRKRRGKRWGGTLI